MLYRSNNYNLNLGTDYKLNNKNNIGLYFTYSNNNTPKRSYPSQTIISNLRNGTSYLDSLRFLSENRLYNNSDNILINTNFQHKFDTLGQSLTLNFDFVSNTSKDETGSGNQIL